MTSASPLFPISSLIPCEIEPADGEITIAIATATSKPVREVQSRRKSGPCRLLVSDLMGHLSLIKTGVYTS
jgi:hypothetical protein